MLRIGFDASPLVHPVSGIGWHTHHLFRTLFELNQSEAQFVGYLPTNQFPTEDYSSWVDTGKLQWRVNSKWRNWINGKDLSLDIFHGPNFKLPLQGKYGGVVTIHDLWLDRFPQFSKKLFGQRSSFNRTRKRAWAAKRVIAVSQWTANDVCELYGLPRERVVVIPNGVGDEFFQDDPKEGPSEIVKRFELPAPKYYLFLGGASPRKNHIVLLQALARCRALLQHHCLVIVGGGPQQQDIIRNNAKEWGVADRVVCVGSVSGPELRRLYKGAEVFIFPSLYEGFGIPLLEAMACGAPIIASNSTALPEIAGNAALFIDPRDEGTVIDAIQRIIQSADLRESLRRNGLSRVERFRWKQVAKQTLDLYTTLCQ